MDIVDSDTFEIDFDKRTIYLLKLIHLQDLYDAIQKCIWTSQSLDADNPLSFYQYPEFELQKDWSIENIELLDLAPKTVTYNYQLVYAKE